MSLFSSVGCREDFLEIFGNRICGTQTGSVYLPVSANARLIKMSFKTDGSGELSIFFQKLQGQCDY
jgi:hypothetical protein